MKIRVLVCCLTCAALCLTCCLPAKAQVPTGFPPFSSISMAPSGPEMIDPATLNAHWTIPIISKPGRIPISYALSYDSSVWEPVQPSGSYPGYWTPASSNWGWGPLNLALTGYIYTTNQQIFECPGQPWYGLFETTYTYYDTNGTANFLGIEYTPFGPPSSCEGGRSSWFVPYPNSEGYTTNSNTGGVITPSGANILVPVNAGSGIPGSITDSNGNVVNISPSGSVTDTQGINVLTIAGSGTPSSPYTLSYPAPSTGIQETYTVKYSGYNIRTNFGCSNISEYSSGSAVNLVSEIDLPNGTAYTFTYESTPGYPGYVTGRVAVVNLPSGSSVKYFYSGYPHGGINCADGSSSGFQRTTFDGNVFYSHTATVVTGTGIVGATTITMPMGYSTFASDAGIVEQELDYSGSTLVRTLVSCPNNSGVTSGSPPACNSATQSGSQYEKYVYWPNGQVARQDTFYDMLSGETIPDPELVTEVDEYDYGSGAPGPLLRKTLTNFATLGNIIDKPSQVTVEDGSGNVKAQTTYAYDQGSVTGSGAPEHTSVSCPCGNLTTLTKMVTPTSSVSSTLTYFDTGEVQYAYDFNNNKTTYAYSSTYGNAYPTTVTNALGQSTSATYDTYTGLETSSTDLNGQTTTYSYDFMLRPIQTSYPDGGLTTECYSDVGGATCTATGIPSQIVTTQAINSSQNMTTTARLDALGRDWEDELNSDPAGPDYATHGPSGFGVSVVANPYRATSDPTYGLTTTNSDILGRPTTVTEQDGSVSSYTYSGNCVTATDEAAKRRQACSDALGRLTSVTEDPGGLGYVTSYGYDVLNNLLSVTENGVAQRSFTYDGLSRLLTSSNPESGAASYTYDANSNVLTKTSPLPNQSSAGTTVTVTYSYDALNRLTEKAYSNGQAARQYYYDQPGHGYSIGRLTHASNDVNAAYDPVYDKMGRIVSTSYCIPSDCSYAKTTSATYDLAGDVTSYTNPASVTISGTYNNARQLTQVTSSMVDSQHPATLGAYTYLATGVANSMTYGNGLTSTAMFNNRLQSCRQDVNSSGTALATCGDPTPNGSLLDYAYSWPRGANNGMLQGWAAAGQQVFNRTFGYDSLNRLTSMSDSDSVASCRGLSWTYDAWGNRLTQTPMAGSCGSWSVSYNADNQMSGYTYDAAGNLENDGSHAYTYDAENNIIAVDGGSTATYAYDADDARVSKTAGGVETDYVIDAAGNSLSAYGAGCGNSCWEREYISAAGRPLAEYGNSTTYFKQTDQLGSTRLMTAMNQSVYDSMDYTPFGEQIQGASGSINKFTGYQRDSESNLDYASARFYGSPLGRFLSPDPGNVGADATNPQSWNMYSYVLNNPLTDIDPTGENCFDDTDTRTTFNTSDGDVTVDDVCDVSDMLDFPMFYELQVQKWLAQKLQQAHTQFTLPKGKQILSRVAAKVCSSLPQGQVVSAGGALGALGAVGGSVNLVTNYNTGQSTLSFTGSLGGGWNGAASGNVSAGYIFSSSQFTNSQYSGKFTTWGGSGGALAGGLGGSISRGNGVTVVSASAGGSVIDGPTFGASESQTSPQIGSNLLSAFVMAEVPGVASNTMMVAACKGH